MPFKKKKIETKQNKKTKQVSVKVLTLCGTRLFADKIIFAEAAQMPDLHCVLGSGGAGLCFQREAAAAAAAAAFPVVKGVFQLRTVE